MSDGAWKIQELASEGLTDRAAELGQLFPEAVTDGKVDIEKLKLLLGEAVEESPERYGLTWPGKRDAIRLAQKQSTATLKPMLAESAEFDTTKNVIIEGDNLEVLKLLQKSYYGEVKVIYIDPPYNTGNDFVYKDDFAQPMVEYLRVSGQTDEDGRQTSVNTETSGRFHSHWLNMMYPRLAAARSLLHEQGLIFISIDEVEISRLRLVCDEVFGEENHVADFVWHNKRGGGNDAKHVAVEHEYVVAYARDKVRLAHLFVPYDPAYLTRYREKDSVGRFFWDTFKRKSGKQYYPIICPDGTVLEFDERGNPLSWLRSEARFLQDQKEGEVRFVRYGDRWSVQFKQRLPEGKKPRTVFLEESILGSQGTTSDGSTAMLDLFGSNIFDNPKPVPLLKHLLSFQGDQDSIILDFFAGSGTTADAVMNLNAEDSGNRRFILVQLPEKTDNPEYPRISDITRERVRRAGKKIKGKAGNKAANLDVGFRAFKLAESNFRNWDSDTDTFLSEELDFYVDNINSGASDDDVVHEILLKAGVPLNVDLQKIQIAGEAVYVAMGGLFIASAARKISQELIDGLLALEPWPVQVVLLDAGFGDNDSLKLNARHQFASRRPESDPDKDNALRTV
ncbi:site-specific DNA-methyltransferase [Arthrobacter sp. SLBN-122]|uniref:site-specific DNA-methyltransferase n=1 Tax=Arthrobacter sp. SLBN-122 TaxID=2768455 RepID=UPI0011670609|nr:site-specific DNA-methyltransferase [Arthrobacter sp. SLBN-122]TQJ35611.1 adenine-specific DNA-methyltransferase [Arthrobacter sp. SLBN-122]